MITIGKPEIIDLDVKSRLQAKIEIDGIENVIWFEVDNQYGQYLCYERSDAFVIGLLNYAMRNGHDITCYAPMTEELHYQLTTYLIEAVYKGSKQLYRSKIYASLESSKIITANAVGTGISCGIDSFHAISTHSNTNYKSHNITHLAFNNVGSHGEGERATQLFIERRKLAKRFADEYGYEFVESNSNIHDVIPQNHLLTNTYTSCFAIYCLQKLYSTYYYASAQTVFSFTLHENHKRSTGYYDLLLLSSFSTKSLKILSEGATMTRLEKTLEVAEYEPSYKYLNVCTATASNCGKCEKCSRTLLTLDAINKLDEYSGVFDIEYYINNLQEYYTKLVYYRRLNNKDYVELYPILKGKVKDKAKIRGFIISLKRTLINKIPDNTKLILKRLFLKR